MHGRAKALVKERTAAEVEAERAKGANYRRLCGHVVAARKSGDVSGATLEIVGKLLLVNCDAYSLWNYRREILVAAGISTERELDLTAQCLRKNPKSYPTWFHRRWTVAKSEERAKTALSELALCSVFLGVDERNFHCWNYRREMSAWALESASAADQFARKKLETNFSNYSAFHDLTTRFPAHLDPDQARTELDIVAHAIFTEPDDQSAWWYADAVLAKTTDADVARAHADALRELSGLEPTAKWPILALLRLLARWPSLAATPDEPDTLLTLLLRLDPARTAMYSPNP